MDWEILTSNKPCSLGHWDWVHNEPDLVAHTKHSVLAVVHNHCVAYKPIQLTHACVEKMVGYHYDTCVVRPAKHSLY